jgi:hypothetical protein
VGSKASTGVILCRSDREQMKWCRNTEQVDRGYSVRPVISLTVANVHHHSRLCRITLGCMVNAAMLKLFDRTSKAAPSKQVRSECYWSLIKYVINTISYVSLEGPIPRGRQSDCGDRAK